LELKMKMTWWFLVGLGWGIMTCEVELMKVLVEKGKQVLFRWWSATSHLGCWSWGPLRFPVAWLLP
jgi:hypothetical protein